MWQILQLNLQIPSKSSHYEQPPLQPEKNNFVKLKWSCTPEKDWGFFVLALNFNILTVIGS
jgi:hypothetical protein